MRVDAHQHFWRLDRGDYGWLTPALGRIHRDFLPHDLAPLLAQAGIDRTILVQAAPTEAETDFLLELAAATPFVAGAVGWIDFDAPDAAGRVEQAAARPGLVGLRPMIQDLPDEAWVARPDLDPVFDAIAAAGLRFDALVKPRHLPHLRARLNRHPELLVVIDHGAKPDIAGGALQPWADGMRRIAAETNACCKLSGLATEARPGWSLEDVKPFAEVLLDAFGPRRLMWGSDWPVLNLNGDYRLWLEAVDRLIEHLPAEEKEWVMGRTAASFYGIG
ncbi:MAG TPA: amidohydrolase family protein [Allosphingosinicella sp.]|jgi:L-fuconolactonase